MRHWEVATEIANQAATSGVVLSVWLAGSVASGEYDQFSDVDLVLVSDASQSDREAALEKMMNGLHPLTQRMEADACATLTLHDGIRIDLSWETAGTPLNGCRLMWGHSPNEQPASEKTYQPFPHPANVPMGGKAISSLLDRVLQAFYWSRRADQRGRKTFERLHRGDQLMNGLRQDIILLRLWTLDRADFLDVADPQLGNLLRATYFTAEPGSMAAAARACIRAIQYIEPGYCKKAGTQSCQEQIEQVVRLLQGCS